MRQSADLLRVTDDGDGCLHHGCRYRKLLLPRQIYFSKTHGVIESPNSRLVGNGERASHRQGFHTIGLAYENADALNILCAGMRASGCHEVVRREIICGSDETSLADVGFNNSIVHRLDRRLA